MHNAHMSINLVCVCIQLCMTVLCLAHFFIEMFAEVSFKKMIAEGKEIQLYKVVEENKTTGREEKREFNKLEVNNNWGVQLSVIVQCTYDSVC